jgi:hypothetical protein
VVPPISARESGPLPELNLTAAHPAYDGARGDLEGGRGVVARPKKKKKKKKKKKRHDLLSRSVERVLSMCSMGRDIKVLNEVCVLIWNR